MSVCPRCSTVNTDTAKFCSECGAALAVGREQRKVVTVLFCDVTGSTALGERLDPESLRRVLARYFERMRAVVEHHGGTVEKFIGDAVMAVFGVPVLHEDDAVRALRAADEMQAELRHLNDELRGEYAVELEVRIGVATGEVVTGTEERLATGDAVNVAARLQQAAVPGEVLFTDETLRLSRGSVVAEPVDPLPLKGKAAPVAGYRLASVRQTSAERPDATPFVGRERELRRLREVLEQAVADRSCQLFTLLGPPGVGKSRLVAEFLAGADGAAVVRGRCLPYGEGITYWPVVEMLKQLEPRLRELAGDPLVLGALEDVLRNDGAIQTDDVAWAFRRLLEAAGAERPFVCIVDDLQWAEETLLALVEHVADLSRNAPILLLCVARPELLELRPAWGGGKLNATTMLLEPLPETESEVLVDALVAEGELSASARAQIVTAAEGNPLFVEQMVALARETGDGDVEMPPTIHALLAARLDRLDAAERDVLARASVEGRTFHQGAVVALAPDEHRVPERLTALVRKELVRPDRPQLAGEEAYRFRHLLIRDAAYDGLPKAERAELHERFADWLEEHGAALVELDEIVGYHLGQACRYRRELGPLDDHGVALGARAARRLGAAGARATVRRDVAAAVALLGRALELLPPEQVDATLEIWYVYSVFTSGAGGAILDRLLDAAARAEAAGDRLAMLRLRLEHAAMNNLASPEGAPERLRELIGEAAAEIEASGDDAALAQLWSGRVLLADIDARSYGVMAAAAERAAFYAERAGDRLNLNWAQTQAAFAHIYGATPVSRCLAILDGYPEGEQRALVTARALLRAMLGHADEARQTCAEAEERLRERKALYQLAHLNLRQSQIESLAGDVSAAASFAEAGRMVFDQIGDRTNFADATIVLAERLATAGRADRARELLGSVALPAETRIRARRVRAHLLAADGAFAAAEEAAREGVALAAETDRLNEQGEAQLALGAVLARAGRRTEAAAAYAGALETFERKENLVMAARARAALGPVVA